MVWLKLYPQKVNDLMYYLMLLNILYLQEILYIIAFKISSSLSFEVSLSSLSSSEEPPTVCI